jgi:hypothetical protein
MIPEKYFLQPTHQIPISRKRTATKAQARSRYIDTAPEARRGRQNLPVQARRDKQATPASSADQPWISGG